MGCALPSDTGEGFDAFFSSASHLPTELESNSFSKSSETDEDHNEVTGTTRGATHQRRVCTRGQNCVHLERSTDASSPNTLDQIPKPHPKDTDSNWISTLADPPSFPFTGQPGLLVDISENAGPSFFLELLTQEMFD